MFLRSVEWKGRLEGVTMVVGEEAFKGDVSVLERGLGLLENEREHFDWDSSSRRMHYERLGSKLERWRSIKPDLKS